MGLTAKQAEAQDLLAGPARHLGLIGGARSGKTYLFVRSMCKRAVRAPGSRHVALRFRMNAIVKSIWMDTLPKVLRYEFPELQGKMKLNSQFGIAKFPNEAEFWIGGLDDQERIDKILGTEFATMFYNECSQIPWQAIVVSRTRLAQKVKTVSDDWLSQRAYYDLNPGGTAHWSCRVFIEKKKPDSLELLSNPEKYDYMYMNPMDNAENLTPEYLQELQDLPERQRRRFFEGRYVAELDGALWTIEMIERGRIFPDTLPEMRRIVVSVDPSGARDEYDIQSDEIGVGVLGLGVDGHAYLLEDKTGRYTPEQWGRLACELYHSWKADRIVYERNFGGEMVAAVIRGADKNVSLKEVTASRGKVIRAEPVAALYEQGKVHHAGRFPALQDELSNFTTAGYLGDRSPNRADMLVWGITELMIGDGNNLGLLEWGKLESARVKKIVPSQFVKPEVNPQTESCKRCHSVAVNTIGRQKRCGQCGYQWSADHVLAK